MIAADKPFPGTDRRRARRLHAGWLSGVESGDTSAMGLPWRTMTSTSPFSTSEKRLEAFFRKSGTRGAVFVAAPLLHVPVRSRDERFDIDPAISSRDYLQCLAVALDSECKVDLVDLDTARPAFRDQIEQHGTVVYRA